MEFGDLLLPLLELMLEVIVDEPQVLQLLPVGRNKYEYDNISTAV